MELTEARKGKTRPKQRDSPGPLRRGLIPSALLGRSSLRMRSRTPTSSSFGTRWARLGAPPTQTHALMFAVQINGETKQNDSTSLMLNRIEDLIAHASSILTFAEGDLLLTGSFAPPPLPRTQPHLRFVSNRNTSRRRTRQGWRHDHRRCVLLAHSLLIYSLFQRQPHSTSQASSVTARSSRLSPIWSGTGRGVICSLRKRKTTGNELHKGSRRAANGGIDYEGGRGGAFGSLS
jgi:hypothetical protein